MMQGTQSPGLCGNLEGWGGEGRERRVQDMGGVRMYTCGQFILIYDRSHHNIIK